MSLPKEYGDTISNTLEDLYKQSQIDKKTLTILKPVDAKPPRFYLLPKIHKPSNPGRPVISSTNCHTTKLSKYVDHYIQPLAKAVKSYIRDTTDLLNKMKLLGTIPEGAILVTMDVKALYSNIDHNEGLTALEDSLNRRPIQEPATNVITTLMRLILTLNCFNFNGRSFLQTKGCAMGTVATPSYANIFMGLFEETHIYPHIDEDCLFYARFIDDIFMIYTGGLDKLNAFLTLLNSLHPSIKFDYSLSQRSIAFLDTCIYINDDRIIHTTLHSKTTDSHNYLHYTSSHPRHLIDNLAFSQALRIRRICSEDAELVRNLKLHKQQFVARGHKPGRIQRHIDRVTSTPREDTLQLSTREDSSRIPLITTFNHTLPPLASIIRSRWDILQIKPEYEELFSEPGLVSFRRSPNIRDFVGSNTISDNRVLRKSRNVRQIQSCQPCNGKRSLCCRQVNSTESFTSSVTNKKYSIFHNVNCKSSNVIYLLTCILCNIQYIGKSKTPFNIRLNNYRNRINKGNIDNLLPVEAHFKQADHDFELHATFTIIEKLELVAPDQKLDNILKHHEDVWMTRLKTVTPNGLNIKLNHPQNEVLL